jgi:hypothetical protein
MENARKFFVAATLEKAKTYVFAGMMIHNPKVVGSSPTPATNKAASREGGPVLSYVVVFASLFSVNHPNHFRQTPIESTLSQARSDFGNQRIV